jgi:hypothetical protein
LIIHFSNNLINSIIQIRHNKARIHKINNIIQVTVLNITISKTRHSHSKISNNKDSRIIHLSNNNNVNNNINNNHNNKLIAIIIYFNNKINHNKRKKKSKIKKIKMILILIIQIAELIGKILEINNFNKKIMLRP